MRFPDPYALRREETKETVLFAASQVIGARAQQEDYFLNFNDECFAIADGVGSMPHAAEAAKLACETAIWAYKHIRQHRYYWLDKKLFMKRIFRTTNMTIWQKRREAGFEEGLATTLMVLMVGPKTIWLGNSGDSTAWRMHEGNITKLTPDKEVFQGVPTNILGLRRLGLVPQFVTHPFDPGDVILMTTDGAGDYLTTEDMQTNVTATGNTIADATRAVTTMLAAAEINGSQENMTAVLVKKLSR